MIYLDHAATTPVPKVVADTMYQTLTEDYFNPSAQYAAGLTMHKRVETWRGIIARALDCPAERLFFTSGGTESDNWAIHAALRKNRHVGKHIVTTAVEHSAVLETCKRMEGEGYTVSYAAPDRNGNISATQILDAVRPDTALVSVMLVNNELGNVYNIAEIAAGLSERNPRTLLHTDAVQGFLKVPCSAKTLGADFISISAHKIGGPKGIGALYVGERVKQPQPLLFGGGQERGFRSGTEATAQIAGFAKAVEIRTDGLSDTLSRMAALKQYAVETLSGIPDCRVVGTGTAPHILAVTLSGYPSQNTVNALSEVGICISAGSACHRGQVSHVTKALALPKRDAAGIVRLSFGPETTRSEIDACAVALRTYHDARLPML